MSWTYSPDLTDDERARRKKLRRTKAKLNLLALAYDVSEAIGADEAAPSTAGEPIGLLLALTKAS